MRIEFSTGIVLLKIDQSLVDITDDLYVVRSLHELDTSQSIWGNDSGTAARFGTPGDFFALCIGYDRVGFRRCPEAEVYDREFETS